MPPAQPGSRAADRARSATPGARGIAFATALDQNERTEVVRLRVEPVNRQPALAAAERVVEPALVGERAREDGEFGDIGCSGPRRASRLARHFVRLGPGAGRRRRSGRRRLPCGFGLARDHRRPGLLEQDRAGELDAAQLHKERIRRLAWAHREPAARCQRRTDPGDDLAALRRAEIHQYVAAEDHVDRFGPRRRRRIDLVDEVQSAECDHLPNLVDHLVAAGGGALEITLLHARRRVAERPFAIGRRRGLFEKARVEIGRDRPSAATPRGRQGGDAAGSRACTPPRRCSSLRSTAAAAGGRRDAPGSAPAIRFASARRASRARGKNRSRRSSGARREPAAARRSARKPSANRCTRRRRQSRARAPRGRSRAAGRANGRSGNRGRGSRRRSPQGAPRG